MIDPLSVISSQFDPMEFDENIRAAVVQLSRESSHTLKLRLTDPGRVYLKSQPEVQTDFELSSLPMRRVKIAKQGDDLDVVFEDARVSWMREYDSPRKEYGDRVVREDFLRHLLLEITEGEVGFYSPDSMVRPELGLRRKLYPFTRGQGRMRENTWDCADRLAKEVGKRRFMVDNVMNFASDEELLEFEPKLTLDPTNDNIIRLNFDLDTGKPEDRMIVDLADARNWTAPLGSGVDVIDLGPASGRWISHIIRRNIFVTRARIVLVRPR